MDNTLVKEATKEEVEVLELVEDVDKSFSITMVRQVILREIFRTLQRHVSTVNPLTM